MKQANLQPALFALPELPAPPKPYVVCTGVDGVAREEPVKILCKRRFVPDEEWWIKVQFVNNGTSTFIDIPRIVNMPALSAIEEGW